MRILLLLCVVSLLVWGCEEEREGCLDYRALVIDVTADEPCDDCCTYPRVLLQLLPGRITQSDTLILRTGSQLELGADTAELLALRFYLHDIKLVRSDSSRMLLLDTLSLRFEERQAFTTQERSLARVTAAGGSTLQLGTLLEDQEVVAIEALVGVPQDLSALNYEVQYSGSVLAPTPDSLLVDTMSTFLRPAAFSIQQDSIIMTTALTQTAPVAIRWNLAEPLLVASSFNLDVTLLLPADALLDIQGASPSLEEFTAKVLAPAQVISVRAAR